MILKNLENTVFEGCDFVVQLPEERKNTEIKILQITDMQLIDATQRRTPERLRPDERAAWDPKNFDLQCGNHIRSLVAQARPDLIIITGDIIYGSFDDNGSTLKWFANFMDSIGIPWAPVFGNHDNESALGVAWQCNLLENAEYCLFKRGNVSGNGNYTVGVAIGDKLVRVLHMIDSNGCTQAIDVANVRARGIYPDQFEMIRTNTALIRGAQKQEVPAFMAFHIPVEAFREAEKGKGYIKNDDENYVIGVDVPQKDSDFGFRLEKYTTVPIKCDFIEFAKEVNIDGVFVGHAHAICFSISYKDIVWTYGLKTGQYDYHIPCQIGGTLITLQGEKFKVNHLPSLVMCSMFAGRAPMFKDFFAPGTFDT